MSSYTRTWEWLKFQKCGSKTADKEAAAWNHMRKLACSATIFNEEENYRGPTDSVRVLHVS